VRRHDDHPSKSGSLMVMWVKRIRNSYLLSVKKENGSHYFVFWSLGTLTSPRVMVMD
jgi:hypothetical protein